MGVLSQRKAALLLTTLGHGIRQTTRQALYCYLSLKCSRRAPVKRVLKGRKRFGGLSTHINYLLEYGTTDLYKSQIGMTRAEFETLFKKLSKSLEPSKFARTNTSLTAKEKLVITLSYLKSGSTQAFLANQFLMSRNRLSEVIKKTLKVIIDCLKVEADVRPKSADCWKKIAERFYERWNIPHCIGAVDGKHCAVRKFGGTGSLAVNYHGWSSIVLLAVCDADYVIRHFNVGSLGGRSDGGIWSEDRLGRGLSSGRLLEGGHIPEAEPLPDDEQGLLGDVNYFVVADEAFKLSPHCMRPYSGKVPRNMRHTNYRLSRARITIECVFGHMTSRWKILNYNFSGEETSRLVIKCCVHLHNFLRLSRYNDLTELDHIEKSSPTMFGENFPSIDDGDAGVNDGEVTRTKLKYYFNYFNPI